MGRRVARMDDADDVGAFRALEADIRQAQVAVGPEAYEESEVIDITRQELATPAAVSQRMTGGCSRDAYFLNR